MPVRSPFTIFALLFKKRYGTKLPTDTDPGAAAGTDEQILVVKLLELPAVELEDRVRAELLENPALEEGREETHGEEEDVRTADESTISEEDGGDTDYDSLSD